MSGEISEILLNGPRHIGQADEPRELLNVVDHVHSTGYGAFKLIVKTLTNGSLGSVPMWTFLLSVF